MKEQIYVLIDVIHQKAIGNYKMETLTNFFKFDEKRIQYAIDNCEILSDCYMIAYARQDKETKIDMDIFEKPLTNTEKKISYIYRHLYKYGNTITTENPKKYLETIRYLGINFEYKRVKDERSRKYHYILTKI